MPRDWNTAACAQLKDCEMGAIVNRELKQRVRPVHGIASHRPVIKADVKYAAKIVQNFDTRWSLWESEDSGAEAGDGAKEEKKDDEKVRTTDMSRRRVVVVTHSRISHWRKNATYNILNMFVCII